MVRVTVFSAAKILLGLISFTVPDGHRGVRPSRNLDLEMETVPPGWNLQWPWARDPVLYDVRPQPHSATLKLATRDLRVVDVRLRVLAHPDPAQLPVVHRRFGPDVLQKVVPPLLFEVARSVVASVDAAALAGARDDLAADIKIVLGGHAHGFQVCIDDVAIEGVAVRG